MLPEPNRPRPALFRTVALLAGFAVSLFGVFWLLDYFFFGPGVAPGAIGAMGAGAARGPMSQLFHFDAETLQNALGNLAQVIAAVLGIAITVVSIVVQLAATRYTSRVADMFFHDRTNLMVMGFFVVACIDAVWVSLSVTRDYVPQATIVMTVVIATGSLLILMPYFAYVFDFLDPERIIARIGQQTLDSAVGKRAGAGPVAQRQAAVVGRMEQLTDIAVNALAQKDKVIASGAIAALRRTLVAYLPAKRDLPAAWFAIGPGLRANPDFVALARDSVEDLSARRIWLEWKALRQLREIFSEALANVPEMAHVVAIETRYAGESALAASEREVLALVVKFMNTYLRAALNTREVRSAYNVLNQYRQLAEAMLPAAQAAASAGGDGGRGGGATDTSAALVDIGGHFKYYAQLARRMGLGFITETAAYDLSDLCARASDTGAACHDRLLATFLDIDKEPETPADERALRGVRKAQVKLATHYLARGMEPRARAIFDDMAHESPERLSSIRDELLSITAKDFWEVVDRGTNFDYLDDAGKERLREFFGWFGRPGLAAPPTAVGV
ncbi:MAG TPA: DUF2254 family protein [Polyangia bacterium]|nr:DUF2254 family protein [Polyangia bacterium]